MKATATISQTEDISEFSLLGAAMTIGGAFVVAGFIKVAPNSIMYLTGLGGFAAYLFAKKN
jgi:hypothetical protein